MRAGHQRGACYSSGMRLGIRNALPTALACGLLVLPLVTRGQARDALDTAFAHLERERGALGLEADDLAEWRVVDRHRSAKSGREYLHLCQQVGGIDVKNAQIAMTLDREGRVASVASRAVRGLRRKLDGRTPRLSAREAIERAAAHLGLSAPSGAAGLRERAAASGPARETVFEPAGFSRHDIPVKLMYVPRPSGRVRLAWRLVLRPPETPNWWEVLVDARNGQILQLHDWVKSDSYNVYAHPLFSPDEGGRSIETDPADGLASPFAWHDTDGVAGPETNVTTGNNVLAREDDGELPTGFQPTGVPPQAFNDPIDPIDLTQQPFSYQTASIVNLFYWNNLLHDIHYQYGFTEAAGNFQFDNYGQGPAGCGNCDDDAVQADAQDGSDLNNAGFGTPPDNSTQRPVMEMYIWIDAVLQVNAPGSSDYPAGRALFGPVLDPVGVTADVEMTVPADACATITNGLSGLIALIDRGNCNFDDKVLAAQAAGAAGVIIANNVSGGTVTMAGDATTVTIPSLFITLPDGNTLKAQLGNGLNATLAGYTRDSALDNSIVIHEYGHGVSNRLTGGANNTSCLDLIQGGGMGEGWSDWWALALTALATDERGDPRGIATYVVGQTPDQEGIRTLPYSADFAVNPFTFEDIDDVAQVHAVGEVWATILWEMFWNLVDAYGFDPDVYTGTGGNNVALQLVMEGLKTHGCDPTFTLARDKIILADAIYGDLHSCRLWTAFAKRGMGPSAANASPGTLAVTEAFDLPPLCQLCGDVDDSRVVDLRDVVIATRAQAGLGPAMIAPEKCNTSGTADLADLDMDGLPDDCEVGDVTATREDLAGLSPGISPVCGPAVGLFL